MNVAYIRDVTAAANASVDESKRPATTEPAESFRKLNVDNWYYYHGYHRYGRRYKYV